MSFINVSSGSQFPIQNLPWGVFSTRTDTTKRIATRIGDFVVDVRFLAEQAALDDLGEKVVKALQLDSLNTFMGFGRREWLMAREKLSSLLSQNSTEVELVKKSLVPISSVQMHLPCQIGDYTDFYSSLPHAFNVGGMFRGKGNELQPNYLHLPVGYHGRSSSVVVSGTEIIRPCGQVPVSKDLTQGSLFKASAKLDFELEMGVLIGKGNRMGEPINVADADDHVFGFVLFNDWSARDIQKFEYVPLGPFNGKNFGSTISPWIVTKEALEPFKCETIYHENQKNTLKSKMEELDISHTFPEQKAYLREPSINENMSYDISLKVSLKPNASEAFTVITESNYKNMYWTHRQQIAHHSVSGCNLRPGDLLGSGTISGYEKGAFGSLLELSKNGQKPIQISFGENKKFERTFIEDGDVVRVTGLCKRPDLDYSIGFGECDGKILPASNRFAKNNL